jgi:hypothetical protein
VDVKAAPSFEPGHFTGRITMADGSPISLKGVTYDITIAGVTAAGELNSLHPIVDPDGTFKLRLPFGLYHPPFGTITYPFEGKEYTVKLDPVDPARGTREGTQGIAQNFVWRLTGPRPGKRNPQVDDANHWFGITIGQVFQQYRRDTGQSIKALPPGSDLTWTLRPISKLMDGSDAKLLIVERKGHDRLVDRWDSLNDLPPANYEVSGVARLPDGSTKRLLLAFTPGTYKATATLILEPELRYGDIRPPTIYWVVE